MGRILNELIDALNSGLKLPKYIIVLLDKDLIESAHYGGFGCKIIFSKTIEWLANNIKIVIETRKEDIKGKNPGAMIPGHPTIIWVNMLTRPFIHNTKRGYVFTRCGTFNRILESTVRKFPDSMFIEIKFSDDRDMFDHTGNMSPIGKLALWREINRKIQLMDRSDVTAKEEKLKESSTSVLRKNNMTDMGVYQGKHQGKGWSSHWKHNSDVQVCNRLSLERAFNTIKNY